MLNLMGGVAQLIIATLYGRYCRNSETRTLTYLDFLVELVAVFGDIFFILRWNLVLGIPDIVWCGLTSTTLLPVTQMLWRIPS